MYSASDSSDTSHSQSREVQHGGQPSSIVEAASGSVRNFASSSASFVSSAFSPAMQQNTARTANSSLQSGETHQQGTGFSRTPFISHLQSFLDGNEVPTEEKLKRFKERQVQKRKLERIRGSSPAIGSKEVDEELGLGNDTWGTTKSSTSTGTDKEHISDSNESYQQVDEHKEMVEAQESPSNYRNLSPVVIIPSDDEDSSEAYLQNERNDDIPVGQNDTDTEEIHQQTHDNNPANQQQEQEGNTAISLNFGSMTEALAFSLAILLCDNYIFGLFFFLFLIHQNII